MPEDIVNPPAQTTPPAPPAETTPPAENPPAEAPDKEQEEWDEVSEELFPGLNGPEKKEEKIEKKEGDQGTEDKSESQPPAGKEGEATPPTEASPQESAPSDPQAVYREYTESYAKIKNEVLEALSKDVPAELKDQDGDPIKGPEDLMKLVDPRTGKAFTAEDAPVAYLQLKQDLKEKQDQAGKYADQVAAASLTVKGEADYILKQYESVFKEHPELPKQLWAQFSQTLKMSPDGKMIEAAPVSLAKYYETALKPYAEVSKAKAEADAARKEAEEIKKRQQQSDRSDIYGPGKVDNRDKDQKEWDEVSKDYFGN